MRSVYFRKIPVLLLLASVSGAQQPAQPSPQIKSLIAALAGRWSTTERYEKMYLTPNGGIGKGTQFFRAGPGGFTLLEDYHSKTPAGELFGVGILWWDETQGLQHIWCINVYPAGCEMFPPPPQPGPKWDGKQLVIQFEQEQDRKKLVWREAVSNIKPESFTQTVDIGEPDHPLNRWLTIHATRIHAPATPGK